MSGSDCRSDEEGTASARRNAERGGGSGADLKRHRARVVDGEVLLRETEQTHDATDADLTIASMDLAPTSRGRFVVHAVEAGVRSRTFPFRERALPGRRLRRDDARRTVLGAAAGSRLGGQSLDRSSVVLAEGTAELLARMPPIPQCAA